MSEIIHLVGNGQRINNPSNYLLLFLACIAKLDFIAERKCAIDKVKASKQFVY